MWKRCRSRPQPRIEKWPAVWAVWDRLSDRGPIVSHTISAPYRQMPAAIDSAGFKMPPECFPGLFCFGLFSGSHEKFDLAAKRNAGSRGRHELRIAPLCTLAEIPECGLRIREQRRGHLPVLGHGNHIRVPSHHQRSSFLDSHVQEEVSIKASGDLNDQMGWGAMLQSRAGSNQKNGANYGRRPDLPIHSFTSRIEHEKSGGEGRVRTGTRATISVPRVFE
jgi:hypothetical protein